MAKSPPPHIHPPAFYNRPIVARTSPRPFRRLLPLAALAIIFLPIPTIHAQAAASPDSAADIRQPGGRLVLVLPFDNRSGQSNLGWIGDSFPYTLDQRLTSVGFLTIGRDDRQYALEHLGLPSDFRPSRATTIRIAQTLDADYVVVGSFNVENGRIQVQAQILEVNQLRMSEPLTDSAELSRLFDVENAIAWKLAQRMDPHFAVAEQTFLAAAGGVRLSSFEDYIRGTSAPTSDERLKRLNAAVTETPDYTAALLALGKEQYTARQYEAAAATLAKVPSTDRVALEAGFYGGLARFNTAKYAEAASAFAFVATRLPLPEVVNDQGVAESRQGKDAAPLFQQVIAADPNDADYHFNLAVALLGRSDIAGSTREVQVALSLHSDDPEATELLARLEATHGSTANLKTIVGADGFQPTTRIRRTWSEASFRQVAFQLDQMRAIQLACRPPPPPPAQRKTNRDAPFNWPPSRPPNKPSSIPNSASAISPRASCPKPSRSSTPPLPPTPTTPPPMPASLRSANAPAPPPKPAAKPKPPSSSSQTSTLTWSSLASTSRPTNSPSPPPTSPPPSSSNPPTPPP